MPTPGPSSRSALRHAPPDLGAGLVLRARLIDGLRGRFDRRLTVLRAGPGFGKTTLLAQAVGENLLERRGLDAWLRVGPADQEPTHLCAGIDQSIAGTRAVHAVDVDDIVERVWSAAPEEVTLILDDVHRLGDAEDAWQVIRDLLDQLPANGHVVLSARSAPPVPVARLLAGDDALVLDEGDLAFTGTELDDFASQRRLEPALTRQLPSWPALAALTSTVGRGASADFLWDEVFASLPPWRTRLVALLAAFDVVDDVLVESLDPGVGRTAADVVADLPLVQSDGLGTYRLHALLGDAVRDRVDPGDRARTLARAAVALVDAGADRLGAEAAAAAGDDRTLHRAVCSFASRPIASVSVPDVVALFERLPPHLRTAPIGCLLDAARHWGAGSREATRRFERAVARAREEGDAAVEALATWRLVQLRYLDDHDDLVLDPAVEALGRADEPLARSSAAFIRSVVAQREGRIADAIAALDDLDDTDPDQRRATMTVRMLDLGRPEAVPAAVESLLQPGAVDVFAAIAVWLRGELSAEDAWAIGATLPGISGRKGVLHDQASMHSILAIVANAAGAVDEAEEMLAKATACRGLVGTQVQLLVAMAEAIVALSVDGEAAAAERLRAGLHLVPLGRWPSRGHLYVLAGLRALVPDVASGLDELDLGPTLALSVAAGRALDRLRNDQDRTEAAALPWQSAEVLRCLVPPPLLAELALAAVVEGRPAALGVLDRVPGCRRWLQRIAEAPGPMRAAAIAHLDRFPARPPHDLRISTFGGLRVERSDGVGVDASRIGRERVRQIVARLLLARRVLRAELAAALWPDLDEPKAADNLRVNLRHLQAALQPDRGEDPPWFVHAEGDTLALAAEGVHVDADEFDEHIRRATEAEATGLPSLAIVELRAAAALHAGEYLAGLDDPLIDVERVRYSSLALAARCRVGELVLARGEPEAAMHEAVAALRVEPLSERAHRLFVRCHLAVGSAEAARSVGARLVAELHDAGLAPEAETLALLARVGVPVAGSAPVHGPG